MAKRKGEGGAVRSEPDEALDQRSNATKPLSIDQFDFTIVERTLLDTMRVICAIKNGLECEISADIRHKIERLEAPFHTDYFIGSAFALVRAIMKDRTRSFGFMSSQCKKCGPRVTRDELDILWLLRAARKGDSAGAVLAAKSISGSQKTANIQEAASQLGSLMRAIPVQESQAGWNDKSPLNDTIH